MDDACQGTLVGSLFGSLQLDAKDHLLCGFDPLLSQALVAWVIS